jgi:hypothetical protein
MYTFKVKECNGTAWGMNVKLVCLICSIFVPWLDIQVAFFYEVYIKFRGFNKSLSYTIYKSWRVLKLMSFTPYEIWRIVKLDAIFQ